MCTLCFSYCVDLLPNITKKLRGTCLEKVDSTSPAELELDADERKYSGIDVMLNAYVCECVIVMHRKHI